MIVGGTAPLHVLEFVSEPLAPERLAEWKLVRHGLACLAKALPQLALPQHGDIL